MGLKVWKLSEQQIKPWESIRISFTALDFHFMHLLSVKTLSYICHHSWCHIELRNTETRSLLSILRFTPSLTHYFAPLSIIHYYLHYRSSKQSLKSLSILLGSVEVFISQRLLFYSSGELECDPLCFFCEGSLWEISFFLLSTIKAHNNF